MQVTINNGYVESFSVNGQFVDGIEVEMPLDFEDFFKNYQAYTVSEGILVKNLDKLAEIQHEIILGQLREQRATECFPIINRGILWYDFLTEDQITELKIWYQAWLDVTDTLIVPEMPEWIN